jgi:large subunit ribosomal protein L17
MKRLLRSHSDFGTMTLRNQLTSLVIYEAITTTKAKARTLESYANHFFNKVSSQDLNAKKLAHETFLDKNAVKKTFEDLLGRYGKTDTTYVRTFNMAPRHGDAAAMAMVSLIKPLVVKEEKAKVSKTVADKIAAEEKPTTAKKETK